MADERTPFHNPFAVLKRPGAEPAPPPAAPAPASPAPSRDPERLGRTVPRAVVRIERSGRGGKEVTVIEHLDVNDRERADWLKVLKAGLGCGGTVEGERLILQGDHRERLRTLLTERGVKKVTVS